MRDETHAWSKMPEEQAVGRTHRETPTEPEFNFDQIFTGSNAEQVEKAAAFALGVENSERDYQALYAEDVLNGSTKAANSLAKIAWLRRGFKQFAKDRRGKDLADRVVAESLHRDLDHMLRR